MHYFDYVIVGAGIIGCSVARYLSSLTKKSICVLEKEREVGLHTSSRNSGVIHSGFNQKPGTLKARFCVSGNQALRKYCKERGVQFKQCGTVVVATEEDEVRILYELAERGRKNGVPDLRILDREELRKLEPHARGISALFSPTGSIVNSRQLVRAVAEDSAMRGVNFLLGRKLITVRKQGNFVLNAGEEEISCNYVINCAGLHADRVARMFGLDVNYTLVPFKGAYYKVRPEKQEFVRSMVYPTPDLKFPFLGIHFTRRVNGELMVGPNASLALGREAYGNEVSLSDLFEMLSPNTFRAASRSEFLSMLLKETLTSVSKEQFCLRASRIVQGIHPDDLVSDGSGIRAQLVDSRGNLVDDFVIKFGENSVHVLNAVSPGMTSSFPFSEFLVESAVGSGVISL